MRKCVCIVKIDIKINSRNTIEDLMFYADFRINNFHRLIGDLMSDYALTWYIILPMFVKLFAQTGHDLSPVIVWFLCGPMIVPHIFNESENRQLNTFLMEFFLLWSTFNRIDSKNSIFWSHSSICLLKELRFNLALNWFSQVTWPNKQRAIKIDN